MLRIFSPEKILRTRLPEASMLTNRPAKQLCTGVTNGFAGVKLSGSLKMQGSFSVSTVSIIMDLGWRSG
jgi:hypothetical protein